MSSAPVHAAAREKLLFGGGAMGERIRAFDWSKTSIGGVEAWPQSLRTAVSILLETHFPMYIAWGPDFIQVYNDGYIPILGPTKHPAALGVSSRETFPEIWDVIGPMFAGVMQGNAVGLTDFLLLLDRHGFLEECYFTFSYSPIRDESGSVGGILTTTTETTERVLGARRLQTLRDLAARTGTVTQEGAAWREAAQALALNAHDLPFTLLYRRDEGTGQAELMAASGWDGDAPAPGTSVPFWPFEEVASSRRPQLVSDLETRWGDVPAGPWPEPPHSALVLPVARAGADHPYGFLVAGVSARRSLDDGYRGFLGLVADQIATAIGNARTYEEETRRAEALAELDRAKTIFFSNISHEFRTPLTLMLGPAEDLLADEGLSAGSRGQVELLQRNSLRLLKLVNTLLDFSRIEAGRLKANFAPADLSAVTADLASVFRSAIERAGLELEVDCPPLGEPVFIDVDMWEKVILNLLSNALKFTFAGRIAVRIRAEGGRVVLSVSDTGVGIPAHELPRIFDRFHRVEGGRGRSQEGSGIGLALVRELVGLNAGRIEVQSAPDVGTTFTVTLPLGSAHLPADRHDPPNAAGTGRTGPSLYLQEALGWLPTDAAEEAPLESGMGRPGGAGTPETLGTITSARVLLADDNADMRQYLARLFARNGWSVEAVEDGEKALASALSHRPDLILTDVMMPRLDGFELLRAVRGSDLRTVPVFLLSARAGEDARIEALTAGADDYLVKPFSARELLARSRALIEASRLRIVAESERRKLHSIFENAPAFICVLKGPTHVFEFQNTLYRTLVGERNVVGKTVREVFPEIEGQGFLELLEEVYRSGKPFLGQELLIKLDRKRQGELEDTFINFVYQPSLDLRGEVDGILVFGFDVTDQVLARRQVEALAKSEGEARARAEDADRRKDEFLAMLAHELRNPLAAIRMALTLMEKNEGDAPKVARQREVCARQAGTLVRLVDDLLDVSRVTHGKVELRKEPIELAAVVRNGLQTTRTLIELQQLELSVTTAAGPLSLDGDPMRLEQVVTNLVSNAAKFTPPGGKVSVVLTREDFADQSWAVLSVKDSGRGLRAEMLERIFEPFVQVDATLDRSAGGLGVGLTLVRHLVALHDGTVTAHSDGPGKGAELVVRLPLRTRPLGAAAAGPRPAEGSAGLRIVLVEDNEDLREMTRELLEGLGHAVLEAENGSQGVDLAQASKPDLVLIDLGLPEIDGYEVARRIRLALGSATPRLVALTGYGDAEARSRSRAAGFDVHIVKPFSDEDLARVLGTA